MLELLAGEKEENLGTRDRPKDGILSLTLTYERLERRILFSPLLPYHRQGKLTFHVHSLTTVHFLFHAW